jgi:hypothetical protein
MAPSTILMKEVSDLVDFLYTIVTKQPRQAVPLTLSSAYFRIGVILVAKTGTILGVGAGPYVFAMNKSLQQKLDAVYVLIYDKDWLGEINPSILEEFKNKVQSLQEEINRQTIAIQDWKLDYHFVDQHGKRRHATCIRYKAPREI